MPLTLVYERSDGSASTSQVEVTIQAAMTRLDDRDRTIFIDYGHRRLYRQEKGSRDCVVYPLRSSQDETGNILSDKIKEMAKVAVRQDPTGARTIDGYPAKLARVLWGPGLERARTAVSPEVQQYGLSFTPLWGELWYTASLPGTDQLFRLASQYAPLYAANPLLRRLDPLGLLAELGGVVIVARYGPRHDRLREVRHGDVEAQRMVPPLSCADLP